MLSAHVCRQYAISLLIVTMLIDSLVSQIINSVDMLPPQHPQCSSFTKGLGFDNNEFSFSSPGYPLGYKKHTDCIKIIQAPYPNQVIRLDFRGEFFVEPSSHCVSDYIEVRDGPYGFSNPISKSAKFCGKEAPRGPPLETTGEFMWLRFKSDEVIEHTGVQAVYSFVKAKAPVKKECRLEKLLTIGRQEILTTADVSTSMPEVHQQNPTLPVDCTVDIIAPANTKIFLAVESFSVRKDDLCENHRMELYDSFAVADRQPKKLKPYCSTLEDHTEFVSISSRRAVIRLTARDAYLIPKFKIVITVLRLGSCQDNVEFDCGDSHCIDSRLRCNTHINCPNRMDEEKCSTKTLDYPDTKTTIIETKDDKDKESAFGMHAIILSCIGATLTLLALCCFMITVKQRAKDRREAQASVKSVVALEPADTETMMAQWFETSPSPEAVISYDKQNGAASHQQQQPLLVVTTPSATPKSGRVRVSKFLEPSTSNKPPDSPIEMFHSSTDIPPPPPPPTRTVMIKQASMDQTPPTLHHHRQLSGSTSTPGLLDCNCQLPRTNHETVNMQLLANRTTTPGTARKTTRHTFQA